MFRSTWLCLALVAACLFCVSGCGGDDVSPVDGGSPPRDSTAPCATDTECSDGLFCNGVEQCEPAAAGADSAGCIPAAAAACLPTQTCAEDTDACEAQCSVEADADGDGVDAAACPGGTDCDDGDAARFPGNSEVCDLGGHDEDCNDATYGVRDFDGDGDTDALCCNGTACGNDCNDLARGVNLSAPEVCNGFDDDCDGTVDEGVKVSAWPDTDFDLHGDRDATPVMECAGAHGFATVGDDCDDADPAVHPAQVEICDLKDNDCDDVIDEAPSATTWYLDADGDGYGSPDARDSEVSCVPLAGYALRPTDCDDTAGGINPSAAERCNGRDDDCNGVADFVLGPSNAEDDDGDGAADSGCVPAGPDCDDRDPTTSVGATEICDGRDNDCNGMIDDGTAMGVWYRDDDRDTYGDDSVATVMSCAYVAGYIPRGGDCDDSLPDVHPNVGETCDGVDEDCDGDIDEGAARRAYYADGDGDGFGSSTADPTIACMMPAGTAGNPSDCNDASAAVGLAGAWYPDADMDTYGSATGAPTVACVAPAGRVASQTDCDDAAMAVHPGAAEICNGVSDDCDAAIDEDAAVLDDELNCGMCGRACLAGEICRAGECSSVTGLTAGSNHVCALLSTGDVWCWGASDEGQTGQAMIVTSRPPGRVQLSSGAPLADATMIASSPGANHTCAIRADATVVCWGDNASGQCGVDAPANAPRAYAIPGLSGVASIAVGSQHSCAVLTSGRVRCWGNNGNGRLGSGATTPATSATPLPVVEEEGGTREITDAIAVAGGDHQTCILHASRTKVSCAGRDAVGGGWVGALGRGPIPTVDYPIADDVLLPAGTMVQSIHMGVGYYTGHSCVLPVTGRPVCWGANTYRQIASTGSSVPTPFTIDAYYSAPTGIALGYDVTCVVYGNAAFGPRVACQGQDGAGALGDGSVDGADSVPDDVVTAADGSTFLPGGSLMVAGRNFSCLKLANGTIACWGSNGSAQFGYAVASGVRPWCDVTIPVPGVP